MSWSFTSPLGVVIAVWFVAMTAHADVQRFAVIIGSNRGDHSDTPLKYAESDATRVYEVLRDLGGFKPVNMVLLQGENARTVEDTVIAVNERVRATLSHPGSQALLLVYYSGHADPDTLHLGTSRLSTRLLSQLVGGSAATFRLLLLDACRLGAMTRTKGGHIVQASPLVMEESLPGTGLALLAASNAHEDAQESDEIRGSFFTHALVSGMMGAADQDGDGAVSLNEVYQYAYSFTLRETSRTFFGPQHPTFRFDFGGQGALVLTRPQMFSSSRAVLRFPPDMGFIVLRDGAQGTVIGEIGPVDKGRLLSLRPGHYFIRGRGADVLYEGSFDLNSGTTTTIVPSAMKRIDYARLVRKGGRKSGVSHRVEMGPLLRSTLPNAQTFCIGGFMGYAIEFEYFGLVSHLGACGSSYTNEFIDATVNEYDFVLRATRTWDISFLSLSGGLGAGAALFTQRFVTRGEAPSRNALNPYLTISIGTSVEISTGYAIGLDISSEMHFLRFDPIKNKSQSTTGYVDLRTALIASKSF